MKVDFAGQATLRQGRLSRRHKVRIAQRHVVDLPRSEDELARLVLLVPS